MITHPAVFSDALLPEIARLLPDTAHLVFDPFVGTGKIANLRAWRPDLDIFGYELEPEWAGLARANGIRTRCDDSRFTHYPDQVFDAIITSPTFGNRMADHHEAQERCTYCRGNGAWCAYHGMAIANPHHIPTPDCTNRLINCPKCHGLGYRVYVRHTYRHSLGRPLDPRNSGQLQWGNDYRAFHILAWTEVRRVLRPGGAFILNIKDHIRDGQRQPVTNWHALTLLQLGFTCTARIHVPTPGQRHGAHGDKRIAYESLLKFTL
jgi:SAM-dependent methyltransferase